jgi:catechol 2,3-dioxygenase-like lactoylglutathione lyase family enzyme
MAILHCTLATRDVRRSAAFFAETLGWRPIERPGNVPSAASWLEIGDGQELHLLEVLDFEPSAFEAEFGRHIAVSYPLDGFDDLKARLRSHGAELIEPKRATSFERFFFRDPSGYLFEVVEKGRV